MEYDTAKLIIDRYKDRQLQVYTTAAYMSFTSTYVLERYALVATTYDPPIYIALEHVIAIMP